MNFKISNEEFAVLCEIRNNQTTSPERLKMLFYGAAEPALKNLEDYGLIHSDISGGRWYYYATVLGKNYIHESPNCSKSNTRDSDNTIDNHKDHPDQSQYKTDNETKRIKWITIGKIVDLIKSGFRFIRNFF